MSRFFLTIISLSSLFISSVAVNAEDLKTKQAENQIITAVEFYNDRQFAKAETVLKDVVREFPDNDAARFYLGLTEFCLENIEAAEEELEAAVKIDSSNFWYRYRLAMVYSAAGKEELTLKMFEDMIRDFPKKYDLYYTMVELYQSQGQQEKALETLTQIETVFGSSDMTAIARFDLLRNMGREDEGYEYLEEFNRKYSSIQVLSILGDRQLAMYNDSLALSLYNEALELQEKAQNELDDEKYMKLVDEFESVLMQAIEPFESAYKVCKNDEVKVNIAEYLKNIYYRFRDKDAKYDESYKIYDEVVKTGVVK